MNVIVYRALLRICIRNHPQIRWRVPIDRITQHLLRHLCQKELIVIIYRAHFRIFIGNHPQITWGVTIDRVSHNSCARLNAFQKKKNDLFDMNVIILSYVGLFSR